MKKIISFLFALVVMVSMANAQTTVVNKGVFSQIYVGVSGGVNYTPVSDIQNFNDKNLSYNAMLEIGKDVTPITGFSLQAGVSPIYHNVSNAKGSGEWKVNRTDLFGNVKFNLMNLFGGYKGYPRRVEIRTVTGIGWNCNILNENKIENDFGLQAGLEFDFNLGKNRNWFITFSPMVQANNLLKGRDEIQYAAEDADLRANIGIVYRLGRGNKSHNFEICDKTYTDEQYAGLYAMYDDCMSTANRVDTVLVEKIIEVEKLVEIGYVTECITFDKNSDVIKNTEMQRLDLYMHNMSKDITYVVCGSADTNTGNYDYNNTLAQKRADAVVKVLKENGFDVETVVKLDALDVTELSRCAIITKK